MKHAGAEALDQLEGLLAAIRRLGALTERSRGVFYCKSRAVLHFHEDPAGLFADLRTTGDFDRFPLGSRAERERLLRRAKAYFGD